MSWPRCPMCDPARKLGTVSIDPVTVCARCRGSGVDPDPVSRPQGDSSTFVMAHRCKACLGTGAELDGPGACPMCGDEQVVSPEDYAAWALARATEGP